jgi:hypothetical protein
MRLGETGVSRVEVRQGDSYMRDALRSLGVSPVRVGHYRVTITRITAQEAFDEAYEEVKAEREAEGKEMA